MSKDCRNFGTSDVVKLLKIYIMRQTYIRILHLDINYNDNPIAYARIKDIQ
jgi:hypothetical protein